MKFNRTLISVLTHCALFASSAAFATDYGDINGDMILQDGDTATSLTATTNQTITVSNGGIQVNHDANISTGMSVYANGGTINLGSGSVINMTVNQSSGMYSGLFSNYGTITAEGLTTINIRSDMQGGSVTGISGVGGQYTLNDVNIDINANAIIYGMNLMTLGTNAELHAKGNVNIQATGQDTIIGIAAAEKGFRIDGNLHITMNQTEGTQLTGIQTVSSPSDPSYNRIAGDTVITLNHHGNDSSWIIAMMQVFGGQIHTNRLIIDVNNAPTNDDLVFGIFSYGANSKTNIGGDLIINSIGYAKQGTTELVDDSAYVYAYDGGAVNLNGAVYLGAQAKKTGETAMRALQGGTITAQDQHMTITGNLIADSGGLIDLSANQQSSITGTFTTGTDGTINLGLADQSIARLTGNSTITRLTLADSSGIQFLSPAAAEPYKTLTLGTLQGQGQFEMGVDIVNQQADKLIIQDTASGHHTLNVRNDGGSLTTGSEVIRLVDTSAATTNTATFTTPGVALGGYLYDIRQTDHGWDLFGTKQLSQTAQSSARFLNTSYLVNYVDTQTLLQRMGELRAGRQNDMDVWVRAFTGKLDDFGQGKLNGYDMKYSGLQFGADRRLTVDTGELYLGAMLGYTQGRPDNSGTVDSYHAGLYGTYQTTGGFYLDALAKGMYVRNQFDIHEAGSPTVVSGKADSNGYAFSLEAGQRFNLGQSGFYIEPQAQLSYQHQNGAETRASNGLRVQLDNYDSTQGRLSTLLGYSLTSGRTLLDGYVKLGYVREFGSDTGYTVNQSKEAHSLKGEWFDGGIGLNAQVNEQHNFFTELSYATGNRFDKKQFNIGYRYQF